MGSSLSLPYLFAPLKLIVTIRNNPIRYICSTEVSKRRRLFWDFYYLVPWIRLRQLFSLYDPHSTTGCSLQLNTKKEIFEVQDSEILALGVLADRGHVGPDMTVSSQISITRLSEEICDPRTQKQWGL